MERVTAERAVQRVRLPWLTLCLALLLAAVAVGAHRWQASAPAGSVATKAAPLDLRAPFTGTPAAGWPDGSDGIRTLPATQVGQHSAAQVGQAMAQVKQLLVAAHLDDEIRTAHDPDYYLALLAPSARARERAAIANSRDPDEDGEITLFATGFHLLPVPVKVTGSMSVSTDTQGRLVVHTNYVYAFPFAPPDPRVITRPWQIVAVQHVVEDLTVVSGNGYRTADLGLWVTNTRSYEESTSCSASRRGYIAPAYSETGTEQGDPNPYYDPDHPVDVTVTCPT